METLGSGVVLFVGCVDHAMCFFLHKLIVSLLPSPPRLCSVYSRLVIIHTFGNSNVIQYFGWFSILYIYLTWLIHTFLWFHTGKYLLVSQYYLKM